MLMTRTSKKMLTKRGKSGHPCLIPDLRGEMLHYLPLNRFGLPVFIDAFCQVEVVSFSSWLAENFFF